MFTDDQLKMIMSQPNFTSEEDALAQQMAMAEQLRGMGQNGRMDKGSNAARALGGISAAVGNYYGIKGGMDLGERKRKAMSDLFSGGGGGSSGAVNNPTL